MKETQKIINAIASISMVYLISDICKEEGKRDKRVSEREREGVCKRRGHTKLQLSLKLLIESSNTLSL